MVTTNLLSTVSTQNASGAVTNATKTSFNATTSAFAVEAQVQNSAGPNSAQQTFRVWFQPSSFSLSAAAFPPTALSPGCLDVICKPGNNGLTTICTPALAAMGTYLYCWVEMPSITTAGGTISVNLIELN